jgi:DNA invertase Pin-like site-specific DNA recombinase
LLIGYARVSKTEQNLDMQMDALRSAGCEKIFADKQSGATWDRKELQGFRQVSRQILSGGIDQPW